MKLILPLSLILIAPIAAHAERFTFGQDINLFRICLEDHFSEDSSSKIAEAARNIAEIAVHRFHNTSHVKQSFYNSLNKMYYRIRDGKTYLFSDKIVPKELRVSIRNAVINCIERKNLPHFENEPRELAEFLDYALVDWPNYLSDMVYTHSGRSILRLYAYSAGVKLMAALRLFSINYDVFRSELMKIWMHRAEQYYDGYSPDILYIRHRFTTDRDRMYSSIPLEDVHTIDGIDSFASRKLKNFTFRDPFIGQRNLDSILPTMESIYNDCSWFGISSAKNYLEVHLQQCYRILFFILELQLRGINTDEDDIYDGPIPANVVPHSEQEIVWNDEAYRNYLQTWHRHYKSIGSVEEIITLITLSIVEKRTSITTITAIAITSTTAMTFASSTESQSYEELGLKKGGIRSGNYKKYFLPKKRFRLTLPKDNEDVEPGPMDHNVDRYGYIIYNGTYKGLSFFQKRSMFLSKLAESSLFLDSLCRS